MCCEPFLQWLNVLVTWCPNLKIINGNETQQVECHAIDARLLATDWGAVRFGLSNSSWDGISHCAVDVWCRPLGAMLKWAEIHLKKNRTVSCISISKGLWSSRWVCSKSANIDFREKSGNASSVTGSLGGKKLVGRQKKWEKNDMNWVNWPVEMHLTTCWKSTWEHHVWCTRVQHVDMSMSKGD